MRWKKQEIDGPAVKEFASRFNLDVLSASIFVRRGLTDSDQVQYYFEDDLRFLHNPFLFEEMADAVQRILDAVSEGERVMVFGDRDVDGITSTVVMTEALENLGLEVQWAVPMGDEHYGLTPSVIDRCVEQDITLLVAVDCGTTNVEEISYGAQMGVDTIIIDHHNPQDQIPPAVATINPKMPDSGYPFDGLCACGLVSKVRYALGFAQSDFFNQPLCLLSIRPGNDSLVLDAIKIENMVELDRITENLVPGVLDVSGSRLGRFLQGVAILVYDAPAQEKLLRQAFGQTVEVQLIDVAPEMWKLFPALSGKSLLRLAGESRLARYTGKEPSEIDVFQSLFTTFVSRKEQAVGEDLESVLDLVALATLADMMPVQDENRILIKQGLRRMTRTPRPGLHALLVRQKLIGKQIDSRDIGWSISPVINASGRMGEPDVAVRLLLTDEDAERARLADYIIDLNRQRREVGDLAWRRIQDQARESFSANEERFVLVHDDGIHRGVTGIIAGRLARYYNAPAAVVSVLDQKAVGSVRTARGLVVTDLLKSLDDVLDDWGGHNAAGGFHLQVERVPVLRERLQSVMREMSLEDPQDATLDVDAELPEAYLTPKLLDTVRLFAPFGQQNDPLLFLARKLVLSDVSFIGKEHQHLRLTLDTASARWPAVFWNAADRVGVDFSKGESVDVVFSMEVNYYQGNETPRFAVMDLARSL